MAIQLQTPITIDPQPAKTADLIWILTMNVNANNGPTSPITADFQICPFVSSTGEMLKDQRVFLNVPDVFTECASNSTLAIAMSSIFDAVSYLAQKQGVYGMSLTVVTSSVDVVTGSFDSGSVGSGSLDSGSVVTGSFDSGSVVTGSFDSGSAVTGSIDSGSIPPDSGSWIP